MGIILEERQGQYGIYYVTLYNLDAQRFIIDNIENVLSFHAEKENDLENQGLPWSTERDEMLVDLYENGTHFPKSPPP